MQSYNVVRIISLWRLLKLPWTRPQSPTAWLLPKLLIDPIASKKSAYHWLETYDQIAFFRTASPKKVFFGSTVGNLNEEKPLPRKWLPKFSEVFKRATFWNICRLTCFQSYKFTSFSGWSLLAFLRDLYKLISVYLKGFKQEFCNSNLILTVNFNGIVKLYEFVF